ncbi:MAG: class I SAM-dependent methyltransferase, partial [Phycisphaerae bacterium]|nr:class I SAM-dependent methyltransferase [Phycisphaerae bacterium]
MEQGVAITKENRQPSSDYYRTDRYDQAEHWVYDPFNPYGIIYYSYVKEVIRHWPCGGRKVLDVGCGDGYIGHEIWKKENQTVEIIGVDYSEKALQHARRLAPELKLYCRDLTTPNWTGGLPGPFDRVNFIETIEHIDPKQHKQILHSIHSVMEPGGLMMISVPSLRLPRDPRTHYKHFSLTDITSQLGEAEFRVDK